MYDVKVELSGEVAQWLRKLRLQARMSIAEASREAQVEEALVIGWETGYPIPITDFIVLTKIYGVDSKIVAARIVLWQDRYFE